MSDELIFNKWETKNFILSIWTTGGGIVEDVEIRLRPSSPFQGRCRCGAVTEGNLARAIQSDAEMVDGMEGGHAGPPVQAESRNKLPQL